MQRSRELRIAAVASSVWLAMACTAGAASAACSIEKVGTTELVNEGKTFGVPVVVNGSPAIQFTINAVSSKSMIDVKLAEHLALPSFGRPKTLIGADGVKRQGLRDVSVGRVALAGIAHAGFPMGVAELVKGRRTSPGTIGTDLLSRFDVEFDFPSKRMNLYRVKDCARNSPEFAQLWSEPYEAVPVEAKRNNFLAVPVSINGKTLNLALSMWERTVLTLDGVSELGMDIERLKAKAPSTTHEDGGLGMVSSERFDTVQIGPATYSDVEISVFDMKLGRYDGLLGLDFFRSCKVWVSYATQQLLIGRPEAASIRMISSEVKHNEGSNEE